MNKRSREELFDAIVSAAFMEYWERELEKMPSDEELKDDLRKMSLKFRSMNTDGDPSKSRLAPSECMRWLSR